MPLRFLLLVLCANLALSAEAWGGESKWVLGPGGEPVAAQISATLERALSLPSAGVEIRGDVILFKFKKKDGTGDEIVRLTHDEPTSPGGLKLSSHHGTFVFPATLGRLDPASLKEALGSVARAPPWRKARTGHRDLTRTKAMAVDLGQEQAIRLARRRALALRSGEARSPAGKKRGHLSAILAQGRLPNESECPECSAEAWRGLLSEDPRDRLATARGLLRRHPLEARLWSLAADAAQRVGLRNEALALADTATRLSQPDQLALDVWSRMTGETPAKISDALPGLQDKKGGLAWLAWLGLLAALLWGFLFWRTTVGRPMWIAVGALVMAAGIWATLSTPTTSPNSETMTAGQIPDALLAPLAGTQCDLSPAHREPEGLIFYGLCDSKPISFQVGTDSREGALQTEHHWLSVKGPKQDALTDQAAFRLAGALRQAEDAGFRAAGRPVDDASALPYLPEERSLEAAEWRLSRSLVAMAMLLSFLFLVIWIREIHRQVRADRRLMWGLVALLALALVIHLAIPSRMVMVYTGYDLTERLAGLEATPRYGAGAIWLYGPFYEIFGIDHRAQQFANRLFGFLALVPLAALLLRFVKGRDALWILGAFVLLPLAWRDHTSEAIMTGTIWLMLSGLALAAQGLQRRSEGHRLLLALPVLCAAATIRPEAGVALLFAMLGLWLLREREEDFPKAFFLACGSIAVLALAGHAAWLLESAQAQVAETGIVSLSDASSRIPEVLTLQNLLFQPDLFPLPWLVWVAASFVAGKGRRLGAACWIVAAFAWIAISAVDLPVVSIPRVHYPALVFLAVPMAMGVGALSTRRWANPAVAVAVLVASALTIPSLLEKGNADEEETLIRLAAEEMPEDGGCLATLGFADPPPPGKTQRHFPSYLFEGRTVLGLSQFDGQRRFCRGRSVALLGTRCFMKLRMGEATTPPTDGELKVCRQFRRTHKLTPIRESKIPNVTTGTFAMYPIAPTLRVGVYALSEVESSSPVTHNR